MYCLLFFVGCTTANDMRTYAFPLDMLHLSTGEDPAKLVDLLKLQEQRGDSSSSDTDEGHS